MSDSISFDDYYLYEVMDDYRESSDPQYKQHLFNEFMHALFVCENKVRIYDRHIKYKVTSDLLKTEQGQIFDMWSDITFKYVRTMTSNKNYLYLIRQKINNIYSFLCDPRICVDKELVQYISVPKKLYYRYIHGEPMTSEFIIAQIDDALQKSEERKKALERRKLRLTWNEYWELVSKYIKKCFENYKPLIEVENPSILYETSAYTMEDNYCIRYICKSLSGYFRNYVKEYNNLPRNKHYGYCDCGKMFVKRSNSQKFCPDCKRLHYLEKHKKYNKKRVTTYRK